jgi:putative membrane protein
LAVIFATFWLYLAIAPLERDAWVLENMLTVLAVSFLLLSYRRFRLSRISYTCIFLFLCVHAVGAHYTYTLTPYDRAFQSLLGFSLNELLGWERNNYDRIVHLLYGLLIAYPVRELFLRVVHVRGFWGYFLPLDLTLSTSLLYELVEWAAATTFGGELGMAYLGTQGDIWDAHKDMALAGLGAVLAMSVAAGINARLQKNFSREWTESLTTIDEEPLGEHAIKRMMEEDGDELEDTNTD